METHESRKFHNGNVFRDTIPRHFPYLSIDTPRHGDVYQLYSEVKEGKNWERANLPITLQRPKLQGAGSRDDLLRFAVARRGSACWLASHCRHAARPSQRLRQSQPTASDTRISLPIGDWIHLPCN